MITQNIIGYDLSAASGKQIFAFNPVTQTNLPEAFIPATTEDVERALKKAYAAWRIYRNMRVERRSEFLLKIAEGIESLGNHLVQRAMLETAYSEARVLIERRRTIDQLRMFADYVVNGSWKNIAIDHAIPGRLPAPKPDLRKINFAIGPVIVFTASNFPLAYSTIGGDSVSALAAGCPVIVKAHESHLGTNALVAEVILHAARETGMPDGVFSSLIGDGMETGKQLVEHPLTAAVGFTGSQGGGRALFDLGAQRKQPIPVFAEMGSVNPIFLLPGSVKKDPPSIVKKLVNSMTMSVGQFCTNPGIMVAIRDKETDYLIKSLSVALEEIDASPMLNQNIARNFYRGIAEIKLTPQVTFVSHPSVDSGNSAAPFLATVSSEVFLQHKNLHHEVFGPFSLIVLCDDVEDMMHVAQSLEGQLTSTVHITEEETDFAHALMEILMEKAGRIIFNGVPTGVEVCAAMTHGGPYPASTDMRFTAVGQHAIFRWLRPVTFQDCPDSLLPEDLRSN